MQNKNVAKRFFVFYMKLHCILPKSYSVSIFSVSSVNFVLRLFVADINAVEGKCPPVYGDGVESSTTTSSITTATTTTKTTTKQADPCDCKCP